MSPDLFRNVVVDPQRQAMLLKCAPADKPYAIHFTPRSGSSRLTDIVSATGKLSAANEIFNPDFIPEIAQALDANSMDDYIQALLRRFNTDGVFGFEVTAHQITAVFGGYPAFQRHFGPMPVFWLIRQDIVAQAVSLAKMVATNVAHLGVSDADVRLSSDQRFSYNAGNIRYWFEHIHLAEVLTEEFFAAYGLVPLRMSYEQTIDLSPLKLVNVIARHLKVPDISPMPLHDNHAKLGTEQNFAFAERFRKENKSLVAKIDAMRAPMLAKLDSISDMVDDIP